MRDFKEFMQFVQEVKRGVAQAMPECEIVVPCIYLEDFFGKMTIEETIKEIVGVFINRKTIKKNSFLEVINTSRNKKYLEEIPHRDFLDLSIVCRLKVSTGKDGMSSTVLSKGLIKHLGMTEEEVFSYAYENTKKIMPCLICDMAEILGFAIPMGIPIVTNKQKIFGSASIVFEDVLETISQRVDGNYYLLPSSRHEMIVVPDPEGTSKPSELRQMVYEVNREQVAEEDFLSDNIYYYDKEKGKLAILNNKEILKNKENITILTKEIVDDFFNKNPNAKTFIIPDSVTEIEQSTFEYCTNLTKISIPNSVTEIGSYAFYGCTNLKEITIPESVTEIGYCAFSDCINLTEINIPESVTEIGYCAFNCCKNLTEITIPNSVTEIGNYAFYNCTNLKEITIPDSVTKIGNGAFYGCTNLKEITIPDSVTEIGNGAFKNCTSLEKITIPDSVTKIGEYAFYGCKSLKEITIPDSVTEIGDDAFNSCENLTEITIPDSVTKIGEYAFENCKNLTEINIPESVTEIGYCAFNCCKNLKEITIPNSVTEIGCCAFYGCENLTEITIPNSVTEIGYCAFYGCKSLKDITIPESVTKIDGYAFKNCTSLEKITIPDSVTEIGDDAFNSCKNLKEIIFQNPSSLNQMKLGENVFSDCDLENINITFLDNELDKDDMTNSISDTKKDENDLEL